MKENKYYTPELEEFHVGFEYEYLTVGDIWVNDIFGSIKPEDTEQMDFEILKKIIKDRPKEIRIKCLDKGDIEELGFSNPASDYEYGTTWTKGSISIKGWFNNTIPTIRISHTHSIGHMFNGKVKNKGELKKLLKMLDIS